MRRERGPAWWVAVACVVALMWGCGKGEFDLPPLHHPVAKGDVGAVRALLEEGADPNEQMPEAVTFLNIAVWHRNVEMVRLLLEHNANPNVTREQDLTPLHYAAMSGKKEVVELLLEYGADVNAQVEDGTTPLGMAIYSGHPKVAELLEAHGGKSSAHALCRLSNINYF